MERLKQNKPTEISRAILCNTAAAAAAAAAFPLCLQTSTATIHIYFMRSAISLSGCGFHIQASCHDFNMLFWGSVLCPLASIRSKTSAFFFVSARRSRFAFSQRTGDFIMNCRNPPPLYQLQQVDQCSSVAGALLITTPQLPVSDLVQLHLKTNWGDAS